MPKNHSDNGRRGLAAVADELSQELQGTSNALATTAEGEPLTPVERPPLDEGPPRLGIAAGQAIQAICERAAADIEAAAEALVDDATSRREEARQIAQSLRARGDRICQSIGTFTENSKRIAIAMDETRRRVMGER